MMSKQSDTFVTEWVIRTVQEQYADDIALVVSHSTLQIDEATPCISYFVPITKKGEQFAQTFLLEGRGYDIWGIPWERLERFADLEEYNLTCLADAEILYARTEEERKRFEALQKRQADYMADKQRMRVQALQAYQQAKEIFSELLFASGSDARMGAGYLLDYLARCIAFSNCSYFRHSQTEQLEELEKMEHVPEGFARLYKEILLEPKEGEQKKRCYELLCLTRQYLTEQHIAAQPEASSEQNYQDLADWYGELSYTWLRIRHYTQAKDTVKAYMWGVYLQSELNQVCADFGLAKIELMDAYDAANLSALSERANQTEQLIREIITKGGGQIREFATVEAFLDNAAKQTL